MSYLAQIQTFLEKTREYPLKRLNQMIIELDPSAHPIEPQHFAHTVLGYLESARLKGEPVSFAAAYAQAGSLRNRMPWLYVEGETPAAVEEVKAPKEKEVKVRKARSTAERKSDMAKKIFEGLADKSKANVIKVFMHELGTTAAGAQSYYYAVGGEKTGRRGRPAASGEKTSAYVRKTPKGETKRELAQKLFEQATDKSRDAIVSRFVSELGMSKNGAMTYYYAVGGAPVRKKSKMVVTN